MMKLKHYSCLLAIAAVLAVTAITTLTACSSENDLTETSNGAQPQTPTTNGVQVTVGAGLADDATTRSTVATEDGKRTLKFTTGDQLYVYGMIEDAAADPSEPSVYTTLAGYLDIDGTSIAPDGKNAKFTGTLYSYQYNGSDFETVDYDFGGANPLARCNYNVPRAYLIHSGMKVSVYKINNSKEFIYDGNEMFADDVETLMTTCLDVIGGYNSGSFALSSNNPIFNCTFSGLTASHDYTATLANVNSFSNTFSNTYNFTTDENGVGTIAIVSLYRGTYSRTVTIKDGNTVVGTIDLGTKDLTAKVYNVTRNFVNLANVTAEKTLQNGDIVTGTLGGNYKVSIAAGATVTLSGATIPGRVANDASTWWAGLTCLGDATIVLADGTVNYVRGCHDSMPGIQAGPTGTTLTIRGGSAGTGKLTAHCGMGTNDGYGAGIGGAQDMSVGNIRIEGGDITATANMFAAGIGSGFAHYADASCGDITITGGTVTATGGLSGAGIGSGIGAYPPISSCGNISITGGTVYSTGGQYAPGIGSGDNDSSCGDISITGTATGWAQGGTNSPRNIGAGSDSNASCGTVSVTAVNFHNGMPTAPCTLKVTIYVSDGVTGSYKTCATITINDGNNTYTVNPTFSGSDMNRYAMISFDLLAPRTYATLTISGTGGQCNPYTYSAVINNVEVSPDVAKDLGTVNLVRQ